MLEDWIGSFGKSLSLSLSFSLVFQLTTLDPSRTLEELKLFPQETLTLEEK